MRFALEVTAFFKVKNNNRTQVENIKNARPKLDGHF